MSVMSWTEGGAILSDHRAEVIVEAEASKARTVERSTDSVTDIGTASVKQRKLPSVRRGMKPRLGSEEGAPVGLLEVV